MDTHLKDKHDLPNNPDSLDTVIRYHVETKHQFGQYARSLGYLDWANQPDPFRRYHGAPLHRLMPPHSDGEPSSPIYKNIFQPGAVPAQPISLNTLSQFFELSLGLSAWKQAGDTSWALRNNPSSGNLHPTEGYLIIGPIQDIHPFPCLFHYAPKEHGLELRLEIPEKPFLQLMAEFPPHAFLVGLTSIHWREAWKYGERAFRYCQHDIGHAIGTYRIAAATLGWKMTLLHDMGDDQLSDLLGVRRIEDYGEAEFEHPDCLAVIWPEGLEGLQDRDQVGQQHLDIDPDLIHALTQGTWHGKANRLSRENPIPWEVIDEVSRASWKNRSALPSVGMDSSHAFKDSPDSQSLPSSSWYRYPEDLTANTIVRQRRSAVAFDGRTSISAQTFFQMMKRVSFPIDHELTQRPIPWDCMPWEPRIHLVLFVHRVEGLPPGLYVLVRNSRSVDMIQKAMQGEFLWKIPESAPRELSLYLLQEGDARKLAAQVSCHQEIAGASAFSLGMVAEFEPILKQEGSWFYRRLFWESGIVGQVLYLEAEAAGVRATGIGCFFDDPVHQVFGFKDLDFQSLYHFTIGGPVDDDRLTTLPPYDHLRRETS